MTKKYTHSKTLWFNLLIAVFAVLSSHSALLEGYLSDGGYLVFMMLIAAGNAYLRTITTQPVSRS